MYIDFTASIQHKEGEKMRSLYKIAILVAAIAVIVASIFTYQYIFAAQTQTITLSGAGATFPFPLIDKWTAEYTKIEANVQINYASIGSGGGIRQYTVKTVDFGASDAPLTEQQFANATNTLHIPETIGGVVPTYNLPGIGSGLKFSGTVLVNIYFGIIRNWNDTQLQELNPSVNLPNQDIIVVHRSDGSGTTFVWTNYLSDISQEWRTTVGKSTSIQWPTDSIQGIISLGGKGNEGVAGYVSQNPYSIGYVEFIYAKNNNLPWGYVQNAAGEFVEPSLQSFAAASSAAAVTLPSGDQSWSTVSIVDSVVNNTQATGAYPITSFTYLLVYKELNVVPGMNQDKANALVQFLWWVVHDGQDYSSDLAYVPLPQSVVTNDEATIRMITFNGEQLYTS
jgi:phosphate transport system substrate-binding protein